MAKRVSIIGGGPCGMASARSLVQEGFEVTVFEVKSQFGGVWVYNGEGPMYRDLNTNLQSDLMMFKDHPFPQLLPQFPDRKDVLEYVCQYSNEIKVAVKFETNIKSVGKDCGEWKLTDQNGKAYGSDFVVIAAGHCDYPYYPSISGLDLRDSRVTHSRYFDEPAPFSDKKVLIVGNASSAIDLSIHILGVTTDITISRRHPGPLDELFENVVDFKCEISKITDNSVQFIDGSLSHPDIILFCTGYRYEFPFLDEFNRGREVPVLHQARARICNLYRNTFYLDDPTLAFVAMDKNIVPMPYSEGQAAAIARVWNNRLPLPPKQEMLDLEQKKVQEKGDGSSYHSMKTPEDVDFMQQMNTWVDSAGPGGFFAERWNSQKIAERKNVAKIKGEEIKKRLQEVLDKRQK